MRLSMMKDMWAITLPTQGNTQVYMHEINMANPVLPEGLSDEWLAAAWQLINQAMFMGCQYGKAFLTIDQKDVKAGASHRRPGKHVDGNYLFSWGSGGGNGWLTGDAGRELTPEKHQLQYCSNTGGMLIASNYPGCDAWLGVYEGDPAQGGDCRHIDTSQMKQVTLNPNRLYIANHAIHESTPVDQDVHRSLIRLTLPETFTVPTHVLFN